MSNRSRKVRGRPFRKGNPGRPKGARNKTTLALEQLLDGQAQAITRKAIELALAGEQLALRLVMERLIDKPNGRPIVFDLPPIRTAKDLASAAGALLRAVSRGQVTPEEGEILANLLKATAEALEVSELEERVTTLEQGLKAHGTEARPEK